jgi:hypothetical protein
MIIHATRLIPTPRRYCRPEDRYTYRLRLSASSWSRKIAGAVMFQASDTAKVSWQIVTYRSGCGGLDRVPF